MRAFFKGFVGKVADRYRKMSIQMVISLSFTAVAVVGMVFMGLSLYLRFYTTAETLAEDNSLRVLAQVNLNLERYLHRMMRISDTMYYRVIKNTDLAEGTFIDGMELLYEENRDSLVSIAVFDKQGGSVSAVPLAGLKTSAAPQTSGWFQSAMAKMENLHFSTPHIQNIFDDPDYRYRWVVSLSRYVQLTRDGVTESGVLLVDMSFSGIEQVCQGVELANGGYLYLIDSDGELIYHPRQQLIYAGLLEENNLQAAGYRDGTCREKFQGQMRQVTVKTVGYTGWKLVGVVPAEELGATSRQTFLFGLALLLFSVFLMAFLNFRISAHISDPIRRLEQAVKELEAGTENVEIEEGGCYEIQRLGHSIRSMVSTLHHLMDDIIQQEGQKRRSELEVLQSQINPHFLYNTLDSVIWMTEAGRYDEAIQMVTSLARLFRISLSRGKRIIPLADELEHARHYMTIQQIRFKNKFTTQISAEPGTEGLYTLKLIVQPILENAIYHGMAAAEDDGLITVTARREGETLLIEVADNGMGMRPEVAASLLDEDRPDVRTTGSGIGVRNVHRRIQLTFGAQYGLTILSEPDEGTTVQIRLPALDETGLALYEREVMG
ncbi:sensor histidine kinase [Pseudoflavonifractor phocaeensis]|uniref:sensor histidine kinase n=1 Tax=Pseudoflavonifractor phocaeensis TaxID=1870988 RepID=UPI001F40C8E1|nr:sensor histidine kinase [Pseudoflavonifractor phocaeensis]MCF2596180.1 sensor histidine kinase [Pseudoflavonifractor phocaeensis]